jgi:hypothetical protein
VQKGVKNRINHFSEFLMCNVDGLLSLPLVKKRPGDNYENPMWSVIKAEDEINLLK